MKQLLFTICMLLVVIDIKADHLSVEETVIPQGGTAILNVSLYNTVQSSVGFQFLLHLPVGVYVLQEEGKCVVTEGNRLKEKGFTTLVNYKEEDGCQILSYNQSLNSMDKDCGIIISITLQADETVEIGSTLRGTLTRCFSVNPTCIQTNLDDVEFDITITDNGPGATLLGDANGNGEVEIGDVTSVLTLMATPEATGYDKKAADANGNGEIEIGDVTTILTIMAGGN